MQNSTNASITPNETSHDSKIIMETPGHHIRFLADPILDEMYAFADSIPLNTIKPRAAIEVQRYFVYKNTQNKV